MIKHPNLEKIIEIRDFLKEITPDFPYNKCQVSTRFLKNELGYSELAGRYMGKGKYYKYWHSWAHDKKNDLYIDITMNQFNEEHDSITILEPDTELLKPIDKFTQQHIGLSDDYLFSYFQKHLNFVNIFNLYQEQI